MKTKVKTSPTTIQIERDGEREIRASDEVVDIKKRTVRFPISSEEPVYKRRGYWEILDHSPDSVDLGRLKGGANVLMDHDSKRVVGIVDEAELVDKRVETLARFSNNTSEAQAVFNDIVDDIRRNVSFGYEIIKAKVEGKDANGIPIVRATRWIPNEVTLTGLPADATVGVRRTLEVNAMPDIELTEHEEDKRSAEPAIDVTAELNQIEQDATKRERKRVAEIQDTAEQFARAPKVKALCARAIEEGLAIGDFRTQLLDLVKEGATRDAVVTNLGMTDKEVERYSLMRMLNAQLEMKNGRLPEKSAPYEYRIHLDLMEQLPAKRADKVQGFLVPYDVQCRGLWSKFGHRAPPADTTENASLVPEDHLADRFIEAVRATAAVMRAGGTSLSGLVGDVSIPREDAVAVEWLTEDENATDVDYSTDSVTMSPTTVAAAVPITRRLIKQSSPDVDMLVRNNIVRGIGVEIDRQALQGTGADPIPEGIRNATGVLTQLISTGALTWAQAVQFEENVEVATNLHEGASYIMHPTMKRICKTTSKDAGSGQFIWADNRVNGYPAYSSTHAGTTADGIVFGNFANVMLGFWGVLDLLMDQYTKAPSGGLVVRAFQDLDVAVRRDNAFCIETLV